MNTGAAVGRRWGDGVCFFDGGGGRTARDGRAGRPLAGPGGRGASLCPSLCLPVCPSLLLLLVCRTRRSPCRSDGRRGGAVRHPPPFFLVYLLRLFVCLQHLSNRDGGGGGAKRNGALRLWGGRALSWPLLAPAPHQPCADSPWEVPTGRGPPAAVSRRKLGQSTPGAVPSCTSWVIKGCCGATRRGGWLTAGVLFAGAVCLPLRPSPGPFCKPAHRVACVRERCVGTGACGHGAAKLSVSVCVCVCVCTCACAGAWLLQRRHPLPFFPLSWCGIRGAPPRPLHS